MTQVDLVKAVSRTTGESVALVDHVGFPLADSLEVRFDPALR